MNVLAGITVQAATENLYRQFPRQDKRTVSPVLKHILGQVAPRMEGDDLVQLLTQVLYYWFDLTNLGCYRQMTAVLTSRLGEDAPAILAKVLVDWCMMVEEGQDEIHGQRVFELPAEAWEAFEPTQLRQLVAQGAPFGPEGVILCWEKIVLMFDQSQLITFNERVLEALPEYDLTLPAEAYAWFSWQTHRCQSEILRRMVWTPESLRFLVRLGVACQATPGNHPRRLIQYLRTELIALINHRPHAAPGLIRLAFSVEGFEGSDWCCTWVLPLLPSWGWEINQLREIDDPENPGQKCLGLITRTQAFGRVVEKLPSHDPNRSATIHYPCVTYVHRGSAQVGDHVFVPVDLCLLAKVNPDFEKESSDGEWLTSTPLGQDLREHFRPVYTLREDPATAGLWVAGCSLQPVYPLHTSDCPEAWGEDLFVPRHD